MTYNCLGAYKGKEIYVILKKEFLFEINEQGRMRTDVMWMISEDRRLIHGGMVIGQVASNLKSVDSLKPLPYNIVYGTAIRDHKSQTTETKEAAKQPQPQPQPIVVSKRVTVEALFAQGEKKLMTLIRESEENLANYESDGTIRLQKLVNEGKEKVKEIRKT